MYVVEDGHVYLLSHLESEGHERLSFAKRSSAAIDYGSEEHSGTNSQEVTRALINRTLFLNAVLPAVETLDAAYHYRMALFCYEARAYRRKQGRLNKTEVVNDYVERYKDIPFSEHEIELLPTGKDGHIIT